MPSFWVHVNRVLREADILIEVLDARMIQASRNEEIEDKIRHLGKKLLFVINKCDLVDIETLKIEKKDLSPSVFISSKDRLGTTILKKKILELSHGEPVTVGVLGYPNVGKSSLINALAGRTAAKTSSESGYTKGLQKIRVDSRIVLLDTPGVFPYKQKDEFMLGKLGSIDYAKIKDPEGIALQFIEEYKPLVRKKYAIAEEDPEEILDKIALKFNKLMRGGKPDREATARLLLKDWQTGKLGHRKV